MMNTIFCLGDYHFINLKFLLLWVNYGYTNRYIAQDTSPVVQWLLYCLTSLKMASSILSEIDKNAVIIVDERELVGKRLDFFM